MSGFLSLLQSNPYTVPPLLSTHEYVWTEIPYFYLHPRHTAPYIGAVLGWGFVYAIRMSSKLHVLFTTEDMRGWLKFRYDYGVDTRW